MGVYERYLQVYDRLLSVHVSGELSQTVQRAREAALRVAPNRIRVVDSAMVSAGLGAMVLRAAEMLRDGADEEDVVQELERLKRSSLYFSVADLSHLARNGRLPRFGEVVGNLLGLRPILRIEKGHIRASLRVARRGASSRLPGPARGGGELGGRPFASPSPTRRQAQRPSYGLKRSLRALPVPERGRVTRPGATIAANGPGGARRSTPTR